MQHFDIALRIHTMGYEKVATNRVRAESEHEAIVLGFCDEVHNLTEEDVIAQIEANGYEIDDEEFRYTLDEVTPLHEVAVSIDGMDVIALLPSPHSCRIGYFLSRSCEHQGESDVAKLTRTGIFSSH